MKWLFLLFFATLPLGQLGAIPVAPGVTVYSHDIALILLLIFWRKKSFAGPLRFPLLIFIASALLSLIANAQRFPPTQLLTGSLYLLRWVLYAGVYFLARSVSPVFIFKGLYSFGVTLAGLGLVQYFLYPYLRNLFYLGWDPHLYRVFSTFLDPNFAGLVFVLTLLLGAKQKYPLIFQLLTLAAFFLTYSRSSYLAFLVGVTAWLIYQKKLKFILGIALLFLLIVWILPKPDGEGVKLFRTVSSLARIGNWQRGMELIGEAPVFGHGFNTMRFVQRQKGWVDESQFLSRAGAGLDNSFQFVWATTGIFGFFAYMFLLWSQFRMGSPIVTTTLTAVLVHSMFSNSLFYPWVMLWLWMLLAAVEKFNAGR